MKTPYERFLLLLKPDQKEIYQVYAYAIFKGAIALSLPIGIQSIINLIQGGRVTTSWVVLISIVVAGIALGGYMQLMQMRVMENIQQKIFARAAFDFTYRLPKIKFEAIYKYFAPELMNRFFDVLTLQKGLSKIIIDFSTSALQIIFGLLLLSLYHSFFIAFSVMLLLLIIGIMRITYKRGLNTSLSESKFKYKVVSWLEELAHSKHTFKLAGSTTLPEEKTDILVKGYLTNRERHFNVLIFQYTLLLGFKAITALGLLIAGGLLVLDQQMNVGQFVAAEIIILLVIDSSEKIILSLETGFDILTSLEKIGQIADLELDDDHHESSLNNTIDKAVQVDLSNVTYTYPEQKTPTINDFTFSFKAKGRYIVQGDNFSGKSTLLHLISGLYKPQKGSVSINNYPISNYNLSQLYMHVGNGLSEETIFEGTLLQNISLGRGHITHEDINWVIQNLKLTEFIQSLPMGIDTYILNNGSQLSESVTQKLLLARSIVNRPKLLLIETRMDRLDSGEKDQIIDFLMSKEHDWTLIALSNDEYMVKKADTLLTMKAGKPI